MLNKLLSKLMKQISGTAYFERGTIYYNEGRVKLIEADHEIEARVSGTRTYDVQILLEDGDIQYDCTCPVGQDGDFCKHCVAVSLAWLSQNKERAGKGSQQKHRSPRADIRNYLVTLESPALIELVMEACKRDDRLYERLLRKTSDRGDHHTAVRAWKDALKRATVIRDFVDYREMPSFAEGISEVVDSLQEWISEGQAAVAIELAEFAAERVEDVIDHCDDSNGELGDLLFRIGELHLSACKAAKPDPEALATRLFRYELTGEWDTFSNAAERYAKVLGKTGLAAYRKLAEAEWAKISALAPGDEKKSWSGNRFHITQIMETLARLDGDIEALVSVKSRDLSSAWNFLQIAETYRKAGKKDKSLEWAERGLVAFPKNTDTRLREFLIEEYLRRNRGTEALSLAWVEFEERACLEPYRKLKTVAAKLNKWPDWRNKALACLRRDIEKDLSSQRIGRTSRRDQSPIVEILLWEKNIEDAWREANAGACRNDLRLKLADLRAKDHPQDSITVYWSHVIPLVEQTNNHAYDEAFALLKKMKPLLLKEGLEWRWKEYVSQLRARFKAKRNFMKLLDRISA